MPIPFLSQESPDFGDCLLVFNSYTRGVNQNRHHRDHMDSPFLMMALCYCVAFMTFVLIDTSCVAIKR